MTKEILLLWVGRRAEAPWEKLAQEYQRRIQRRLTFTERRVRPAEGRDNAPGRAVETEAERLRACLRPDDVVVALDERGRQSSTEELARWLSFRECPGRLVFLVGSDLGLASSLRAEAHEVLALSRLTLAHQLARVAVLEQLYRCLDLLAGGAYHRGNPACFLYNARPGRRR